MKLNVLLAEDLPESRKHLKRLLNEYPHYTVVADFASQEVTANYLLEHHESIDALFLDIKLDDGTAFDILFTLQENNIPIPPTVIISSHDEAKYTTLMKTRFNAQTVYYFRKLIDDHWEAEKDACYKAIVTRQKFLKSQQPKRRAFSFERGNTTVTVRVEDIAYITCHDKICRVYVKDEDDYFRDPANTLKWYHEQINDPANFLDGGRHLIVNRNAIQGFADDCKTIILHWPEAHNTATTTREKGRKIMKATFF